MAKQVIIDTDCGIDDALAILMALLDPAIEVVAFTCVAGNVGLNHVKRNVGIVLDAVGAKHIPIYAGADRPIFGPLVDAAHVHGGDGLGDAGFPPTARAVEKEHGALALARLARAYPGATLVALGPLTNVALALAVEPELPNLYGETIIMGGAVHAKGNASAVAEFNIYADPESAQMVLDRGIDPILLPLEAMYGAPIDWDTWDRLVDAGPIGRRFIAPMTAAMRERYRKRDRPGIFWPDPLTMAVLLDPSCAQTYRGAIAVDVGHSAARGMTTLDWRTYDPAPPNATIVDSVDLARFTAMVEHVCKAECFL